MGLNIYKEMYDKMCKEEDSIINEKENEFWEIKGQIHKKYNKMRNDLQQICPHENTEAREDFDYHKRETWYETYCTDCHKLLERK